MLYREKDITFTKFVLGDVILSVEAGGKSINLAEVRGWSGQRREASEGWEVD